MARFEEGGHMMAFVGRMRELAPVAVAIWIVALGLLLWRCL